MLVFPHLSWTKDAGFCMCNGNILGNWFERLIISLTSAVLLIESFTSFSVIAPGHSGFSRVPLLCLLLSHWPNCTGCLWRPEVWVFKESREEALVWRTSWLWNIPLHWGLLVGLLCHWWTHFIMSCICAYTYIGFRFVENRNVYLQIWNPYIHQTLVFHLLE